VVDVVIRGCSRGGACRTKIKPGDRPALSVATRQSSRYLDGSCMKQEPPIERSEALRDAPVFGSSPFGGIFSQGARPDALAKMLPPKVWTFARVDQIRSRQRPLRPEKNCTRRRNELIAKGAMNTGE
jgi:hypothetical protein